MTSNTDYIDFTKARKELLESFNRGEHAAPEIFLAGRGWEIDWGRQAAIRGQHAPAIGDEKPKKDWLTRMFDKMTRRCRFLLTARIRSAIRRA